MDLVKDAWNAVSDFLGQLAGAIAVISALYGLFRKWRVVRRWAESGYRWSVAKWRQAIRWTYAMLGIATTESVEALRRDFEERLVTHAERRPAADPGPTVVSVPHEIERVGVKIGLTPAVANYIGKIDPITLDRDDFRRFLQGPFCRKCSHTLVAWKDDDYFVTSRCPDCGYKWKDNNDAIPLNAFWTLLWKKLDAEFRRTGRVEP